MQNYVQTGDFLTLPAAPYDLDPGDGALVGVIFGVSANASLSGAECVLGVEGVYTLPKVSALAIAVGDTVYWDDTAKLVDKTSSGNTRIGMSSAPKATPIVLTGEAAERRARQALKPTSGFRRLIHPFQFTSLSGSHN